MDEKDEKKDRPGRGAHEETDLQRLIELEEAEGADDPVRAARESAGLRALHFGAALQEYYENR